MSKTAFRCWNLLALAVLAFALYLNFIATPAAAMTTPSGTALATKPSTK